MNDTTVAVHSVEKALSIIETLSRSDEMGITELSRELGIGKATIYRIITTLRNHGYVEQTANEKYKLNFKLFELGNRMVNKIGIRNTVHPYLEKLALATRETTNLAVLDQSDMIYIDRIESHEPLRIGLDVGARFPAFCSALGLAYLAYLNLPEVDSVLMKTKKSGKFKKYTDNTIVDIKLLKEQLAKIKVLGYSYDDEYLFQGIRSLGAPLFNHSGRVIAAISVNGPVIRMTDEVVSECIPILKETAKKISVQLGYSE